MQNVLLKFFYKVYALHGFLGVPNDLKEILTHKHLSLHLTNLWADFPIKVFEEWAVSYNLLVKKNCPSSKNILVGYSLGGRLALHCMLQSPALWQAAVFISTHYGIEKEKEKQQRKNVDLKWANQFLTIEWDNLMQQWNNQAIFQTNDKILYRDEKNYNRQMLSNSLNTWSLGSQSCLRKNIEALDIPILWIVGAQDKKFCELGADLKFKNIRSKFVKIPKSGHRVFLEQKERCRVNILKFIYKLEH